MSGKRPCSVVEIYRLRYARSAEDVIGQLNMKITLPDPFEGSLIACQGTNPEYSTL